MDWNLIAQIALFAALAYFMMRGCGGMRMGGGCGTGKPRREGRDSERETGEGVAARRDSNPGDEVKHNHPS